MPLDRHQGLDLLAHEIAFDLAFQANGIDACLRHINRDLPAGAARKADDAGARATGPHQSDQSLRRSDAPALEILGTQRPRPAVEDLDDIGTGLDLPAEI